MRDVAARIGWNVAAEFTDEGPAPDAGFRHMLASADTGDFDRVAVVGFETLGRQRDVAMDAAAELTVRGLTLLTANDGQVQPSDLLGLVTNLVGAFAGYAADQLVELRRTHEAQMLARMSPQERRAAEELANVTPLWPPGRNPTTDREREKGQE